jgi:hypothetical protein
MKPPTQALAVLGVFGLLAAFAAVAGGSTAPRSAQAALDCNDDHRLRVEIVNEDTEEFIAFPGSEVRISPDPQDGSGTRLYEDNGRNDDSGTVGRIQEDSACEITDVAPDPVAYTLTLEELAGNCELADGQTETKTLVLVANQTVTYMVEDCDPSDIRIAIDADDDVISCRGSTDIEIEVWTDGRPAPDGTEIELSASFGTISPSDVETDNGDADATYRAPGNRGGSVTITAMAFGKAASTRVNVVCSANPAQLGFPSVSCGSSTARVTFKWTPGGGASQWVDLSLADNRFAPGTFIGSGPHGPGVSELTWTGLGKGRQYFWRVNTWTGSSWVVSSTGTFVPCDGPEIRGVNYSCISHDRARVTFFWSPSAPTGSSHWLDLTLHNNRFARGTFIGVGVGSTQQSLTWSGILADRQHYWRVNTLLPDGWDPSRTGTFTAYCYRKPGRTKRADSNVRGGPLHLCWPDAQLADCLPFAQQCPVQQRYRLSHRPALDLLSTLGVAVDRDVDLADRCAVLRLRPGHARDAHADIGAESLARCRGHCRGRLGADHAVLSDDGRFDAHLLLDFCRVGNDAAAEVAAGSRHVCYLVREQAAGAGLHHGQR